MSDPVLQQAQALLERNTGTAPNPDLQNALLQQGLACHLRMFELAEADPAAAIALAIAGAELLQGFQQHATTSAAIPDWVLVHEEQCCRYGAIWVHQRLQQQQNPTLSQLQRSLDLLQRLQQLHPEPLAWIEAMHRDLEQALSSAPAPLSPPPASNQSPQSSKPPSLHDCIWIAPNPHLALQELGRWARDQPLADTTALDPLIEAACRTRDAALLSAATARLSHHPPAEPWHSLYTLKLQHAAGVAKKELNAIARQIILHPQLSHMVWDECSWRLLAGLLENDPDPQIQANLAQLLAVQAPLEQAVQSGGSSLADVFAARSLPPEDAQRAASLYRSATSSIRKPYAFWAEPSAVDPAMLEQLVQRVREAQATQRGFSLVRLGDGEGLFLCGRRADLGGAISNGAQVAPHLAAQGHCLQGLEHEDLRRQLSDAIAQADWIGIPDVQQCLSGPVDCISVASGLQLMLQAEQWPTVHANLVVGGCHIHNSLLAGGFYTQPPFNRVNAVIGPSLPRTLQQQQPLLWLKIPGEARLRQDAFGTDAHYPRVFEHILAAIAKQIQPGDLVLVGAGILGKIYCEAVRQRGGIALDVGSVLDLCSGHGGTRGEYRMHPGLNDQATQAFRPEPHAAAQPD